MRVLVLNAGSSTLKWTLFDGREHMALRSAAADWDSASAPAREEQLTATLREFSGFEAVGHRVVHGGTRFREAVVVDDEVRIALDALASLDPLHMLPALTGIEVIRRAFPKLPQVAVFDTSFHAQLPPAAATYALPFEWSERFGLRRFGFHGLSVEHSLAQACALLGHTPRRMIVCHLGSGCSVSALLEGRSVDTSMGFTPLEGLVMATRSGSIDPGLLLHLVTRCDIGIDELSEALYKRSGLLGISGVSGDLRRVLAAADEGAPRARLAYASFVWSLRRAIGAMAGVLDGVDALVFTGGIGENSARVRADACAALGFAGLRIGEEQDSAATADRRISSADSRVSVLVVHAREDLVVLQEVLRLLDPKAGGQSDTPADSVARGIRSQGGPQP
jgi:acetate kinase